MACLFTHAPEKKPTESDRLIVENENKSVEEEDMVEGTLYAYFYKIYLDNVSDR